MMVDDPAAPNPMARAAALDVLWTPGDWARAIAAVPAGGPLPSRCVLVPREAVAHALRREIVRSDLGRALAGTRFVPTAAAAVEVLRAAGTDFRLGEEGLRPARLQALFRTDLRLRHFTPALLRDKPGWDVAFARAIGDLEAAGLEPHDVERAGATGAMRDVALIWRAVEDAAGGSWTLPHVYLEAAELLEREPGAWPFPRPVLAATSLSATTAVARFLRAIPDVRLAVLGGRPVRGRHLERAAALLGDAAAVAIAGATPPRASATERDLLASYLFEPPAVLADAARPRSAGPDGTVDLEEHAGVESELEATADWVARQVLRRGRRSRRSPCSCRRSIRSRVSWRIGSRVCRGRAERCRFTSPAGCRSSGTAAGARALAVVRGASRSSRRRRASPTCCPRCGRPTDADRRLSSRRRDWTSRGRSARSAATRPGRRARSSGRGARSSARPRSRRSSRVPQADDDPEAPGIARRAWDLERLLARPARVRPGARGAGRRGAPGRGRRRAGRPLAGAARVPRRAGCCSRARGRACTRCSTSGSAAPRARRRRRHG